MFNINFFTGFSLDEKELLIASQKIFGLFHNKFEIDIYEEAMQEAYELTLEKKVLKI